MMKLVIKFPTRSRPEKFQQTFKRYQNFLSKRVDVRFLVSMDEDDASMNNNEIKDFLNSYPNTSYYYGNSKTKIEAINADLDKLPEDYDIILLASDDMIPKIPGYDALISREMELCFPDTDGVLHYNDGRAGERLNTLCILGKKYFERFGYIYHPAYISVYPDNEFTDVSRILGKVVYRDIVIIEHGWIQYTGYDELAQRNENKHWYEVDGKTYNERKAKNFDLPGVSS